MSQTVQTAGLETLHFVITAQESLNAKVPILLPFTICNIGSFSSIIKWPSVIFLSHLFNCVLLIYLWYNYNYIQFTNFSHYSSRITLYLTALTFISTGPSEADLYCKTSQCFFPPLTLSLICSHLILFGYFLLVL